MAVDTPAKIAIVGAGPVGLEAALYARYLGYDVDLYERGRAVEHLQQAGHVRLWAPWRECVTSLGTASLENQDSAWRAPRDEERLTAGQLAERYFLPLAGCDLLADCLQEQTEVEAIGREMLLKSDYLQDERRIDVPFRLVVRDAAGRRRIEQADVVFDCSGTAATPNFLGNGGLPALGELENRSRIDYAVPDMLGARRADFADRHTLVVGAGYAAATTVTLLARLAAEASQTRLTWITRREAAGDAVGPVAQVSDDPLPDRAALAQRANQLATQPGGILDHRPATAVEALEWNEAKRQFEVELSGRHAGHNTFDRIVANVGHRPDRSLWNELQMLECPATGAPLPMADFLRRQAAEPAGDPANFRRALAQALLNPEPDFYVLGAKSYGRRGDFLLAHGREQIVALFTVIGDRESLDLYATQHRMRDA